MDLVESTEYCFQYTFDERWWYLQDKIITFQHDIIW